MPATTKPREDHHTHHFQREDMLTRVAGALFEKYCSSAHLYHAQKVESIIEDEHTISNYQYREAVVLAQDEECMRRMYEEHEQPIKIQQLAQYYKYNRELPRVLGAGRQIEEYHRKLRNYDFKVVKAVLKKQQGVSLTSQHDESSIVPSNVRSRYSSVLHPLANLPNNSQREESQLLKQLCDTLEGTNLMPIKSPKNFTGKFTPESKRFELFLIKHQPFHQHNGQNCFIKKQQHFSRNKENQPHSKMNLLPRRHPNFKKKSVEPTTANDTISREQKPRRQAKRFIGSGDIGDGFTKKRGEKMNVEKVYRSGNVQPRRSLNNTVKVTKPLPANNQPDKKNKVSHTRKDSRPSRPSSIARLPSNPHQDRRMPSKTDHPLSGKPRESRESSLKRPRASTPKSRQNSLQKSTENNRSKSRLSRQNSRESVRARLCQSESFSGLKQAAKKQPSRVQQLLNRKLALFGRG